MKVIAHILAIELLFSVMDSAVVFNHLSIMETLDGSNLIEGKAGTELMFGLMDLNISLTKVERPIPLVNYIANVRAN